MKRVKTDPKTDGNETTLTEPGPLVYGWPTSDSSTVLSSTTFSSSHFGNVSAVKNLRDENAAENVLGVKFQSPILQQLMSSKLMS
jgi:hypothetical protein